MHRGIRISSLALALALVAAACGGGDEAADTTTTNAATVTPTTSGLDLGGVAVTTIDPTPVPEAIPGAPVVLQVPGLWRRTPSGPSATFFFMPSDNTVVSERLGVISGATFDPVTATYFGVEPAGVVTQSDVQVGVDQRDAILIRYPFLQNERPAILSEWVVEVAGETVLIVFIADADAPDLYLAEVEQVIATAEFQG